MANSNWLAECAEHSLGNFESTEENDRNLSIKALHAQRDHDIRNDLFVLLSAKILRFSERFRYWSLEPWTFDDVLQETFPVFVDTVDRWRPRFEGGEPAGYLYYFLRVYPLWLSDAVKKLTGRNHPQVMVLPESGEQMADPTPYESDSITHVSIGEFCSRLTDDEEAVFRLKVESDLSIPKAAARTGLARRTAYRRWDNIVELGREFWLKVG